MIYKHKLRAIRSLMVLGFLSLALLAATANPVVAGPSASRKPTSTPTPTSMPTPAPISGASFQGLGQMPGVVIQAGQCGTQASGISGDGSVIVGAGCVPSSVPGGTADQAFRWTVTGGYQRLGDLGGGNSDARAASFDGSVIVGQSRDSTGTDRAYRWTAAQGMAALPLLQAGTLGNEADTVSDDGTMAAGGNVWWKTSGQTGNFGGGPCTAPQAPLGMFDLSADGSVAAGAGKGGLDMFGQQATNAYRSTPNGNCQDIDAVFNRNSDASGISADGATIVGEAQDANGHYRAFRWTAATGMVDLSTLGGGNLLSRAMATNRDGSVVVGLSLTTTSSASDHAFVWTAQCGMRDLNTVLQRVIPKGWILQEATDISEGGTIITGWGISPPVPGSSFGQTEPWRAVLPAAC